MYTIIQIATGISNLLPSTTEIVTAKMESNDKMESTNVAESIGTVNVVEEPDNQFVRPNAIQTLSNAAFSRMKNTPGNWMYGGCNSYELVGLDEPKLIRDMIAKSSKEVMYFVDVGAANGDWGKAIVKCLQDENVTNKRFHVFSITGGRECEEGMWEYGNITLYQLTQFKIENIDEELEKRGYHLKDQVDLLVSCWTLRHLADPFGTLNQMYNLLSPENGKLMSNGFFFKKEGSSEVECFPLDNENIILHSNAVSLFRRYNAGRDVNQFMLMRTNQRPLGLPIKYTGNIGTIGHGYQNDSWCVTEFRNVPTDKPSFRIDWMMKKKVNWYYFSNERCKQLYAEMKPFVRDW